MRYWKLLLCVMLRCIDWYKDTEVWYKLLYQSFAFKIETLCSCEMSANLYQAKQQQIA